MSDADVRNAVKKWLRIEDDPDVQRDEIEMGLERIDEEEEVEKLQIGDLKLRSLAQPKRARERLRKLSSLFSPTPRYHTIWKHLATFYVHRGGGGVTPRRSYCCLHTRDSAKAQGNLERGRGAGDHATIADM